MVAVLGQNPVSAAQEPLYGAAGLPRINGGGFPAEIWADYTAAALEDEPVRDFDLELEEGAESPVPQPTTTAPVPPTDTASPTTEPTGGPTITPPTDFPTPPTIEPPTPTFPTEPTPPEPTEDFPTVGPEDGALARQPRWGG